MDDQTEDFDGTADDFEIEVTDLHTGAAIHHSLSPSAPNQPARGDDGDGEDGDRGGQAANALPGQGRRYRLRAAVVSGVVLLAVALVALINPAAKSSLSTMLGFPTPVPSPTPLPGANLVYLTRGAPWGVVTMDGKHPQFASLGMMLAWIKLPPGHHTIVVTQAPFPTLRCTISQPVASGDNCPLVAPLDPEQQFGGGADAPPGSRFIDLGARFSALPSDAQDALIAAVSAAVAPPSMPVTLQPGDHYLRDDGHIAVAQTPLQAYFIPTLLTPAGIVPSSSPSCASFCDLTGVGQNTGASWGMWVALLGSWHAAAPGGVVFAEHAPMFPADPAYEGLAPSLQVALSIYWTGSWQVGIRHDYGPEETPVCQAATQMMAINLNMIPQVSVTGMGWVPGHAPEQGCVINMTLSDPTASDPIYVYYHFGVLLAANEAAHRAFPALPQASADERALARQILANSSIP